MRCGAAGIILGGMTMLSPLRSAPLLMALVLLAACQQPAEKPAKAEGDPHAGLELPPGHPAIDLSGAQGGVAAEAGASRHPRCSASMARACG